MFHRSKISNQTVTGSDRGDDWRSKINTTVPRCQAALASTAGSDRTARRGWWRWRIRRCPAEIKDQTTNSRSGNNNVKNARKALLLMVSTDNGEVSIQCKMSDCEWASTQRSKCKIRTSAVLAFAIAWAICSPSTGPAVTLTCEPIIRNYSNLFSTTVPWCRGWFPCARTALLSLISLTSLQPGWRSVISIEADGERTPT